jgi:nickel/cobalt exporter
MAIGANPFLSAEDGKTIAPSALVGKGDERITRTQLSLREKIADALTALRDGSGPETWGVLIGGAFLYGIFHAAGPGHRKSVVFSLFMGRRTAAWEPLAAGLLAAATHAGISASLIFLLKRAGEAISSLTQLNSASLYLEGITFSMLAIAAIVLILFKAARIIGRTRIQHAGYSEESPEEHKNAAIGKGGPAMGKRSQVYPIIVLASLVPCPGATMILLLSLHLGVISMGMAAVLAMSLGMALVISAAGYIAYFSRKTLFLKFKRHAGRVGLISDILETGSYLFMGAFSLYAAWPFLVSL